MRLWSTAREVEPGGGFVPTMGALHEGHLSLIRAAKTECGRATVSIFVNPLQFGAGEDLARYPRPIERDLERAEAAGADAIFAPTAEEMFPGDPTRIVVPGVSEQWEGERRPGHFEGVATVVAKLFGIARPERAYFGRKDLQQCAVISKMVGDLSMPVRLRIMPTVRESDGLALSSRNAYLSDEERLRAPLLHSQIEAAARAIEGGESPRSATDRAAASLVAEGFEADYVAAVRDADLLEARGDESGISVIAAARLGATRLIDNVPIR